MGVKIEGDIKALKKTLKKLTDFDYKGLNTELGQAIRSSTLKRFKDQRDPEGKKWEPSRRVLESGQTLKGSWKDRILIDKGILKKSIKDKATDQGVAIGTNLVYARIHQYGGVIRAKLKKSLKIATGGKFFLRKKAVMPARAYLGINAEDMEEIKAIVNNRTKECIDK